MRKVKGKVWLACLLLTFLKRTHFLFIYYFLLGGKLLYNVVLISAAQQLESAISVYIAPPSWVSLLTPPHPTPLGCHRAPKTYLFLFAFIRQSGWSAGVQAQGRIHHYSWGAVGLVRRRIDKPGRCCNGDVNGVLGQPSPGGWEMLLGVGAKQGPERWGWTHHVKEEGRLIPSSGKSWLKEGRKEGGVKRVARGGTARSSVWSEHEAWGPGLEMRPSPAWL